MIIAHSKNLDAFKVLIDSSLDDLRKDADSRQDYYLQRGGINLEKDVYSILKENAKGTIYENNIELVSGQKFPDIVAYVNASEAYGIEVKTTKQNKWKSTGSSIFEGTRVKGIKNIYMLFGKLYFPVEFKCRKYEECLYDVAVTHSPRYLIDMNIEAEGSIFSKIGIEYSDLRQLVNPFKPIKKFYRGKLKEGENLWWVDNFDEEVRDFRVKLWGGLTSEEKDSLRIRALAYYPSLLGNNNKKYANLATWLVAQFGIVNHALRDTFSAGGQIKINDVKFPQIYKHLFHDLDSILEVVRGMDDDDAEFYWGVKEISDDKIVLWFQICREYFTQSLDEYQLAVINGVWD